MADLLRVILKCVFPELEEEGAAVGEGEGFAFEWMGEVEVDGTDEEGREEVKDLAVVGTCILWYEGTLGRGTRN